MTAAQAPDTLRAVLEAAQRRGFLGPGPVIEHVELAHGLGDLISDPPASALDLGTGAGVPGLVLALRWPASNWVLLDGSRSRMGVLEAAVAELSLGGRVRVVCGRAEDVGRDPAYRARFDLVTARSFGPPATTAECGAPFLRPGGILVVSEPPEVPPVDGGRWPADGLAHLGLVAGPARADRPRAQVLEARRACPERYPRRVGVPAKRPLF